MSKFEPHDYFGTREKPYVSRKVFKEHVRKNYENARELNDKTEDLQSQTEQLHGEMRDYLRKMNEKT